MQVKLQQFLNNQYKKKARSQHRSRERSKSRERHTSTQRSKTAHTTKVSSSVAPRHQTHRGEAKTAHGGRHHQHRGDREFSHRISHYRNASKKASAQIRDKSGSHRSMPTVQEGFPSNEPEPEVLTESIQRKPDSVQAVHCFGGLKKLSKRNEHTSRIRETQNAACTIQRAWRNYCKRTTKVPRY